MELATRIFDVVVENLCNEVRGFVPERPDQRDHWRRTLRAAALLHDIGHLPFSHATEKELLPAGWNHERLTYEFIRSDDIRGLLESLTPPMRAEEVAKLAVGPENAEGEDFSTWDLLLSEMIVGDVFGADRMDYLLRDSLHAGVAYGRYDHQRLIDTLRILPSAKKDDKEDKDSGEPELGVEEGGIHAAEGLLLARYFMFMQVYLHHVRRIYDRHLADFLMGWLPGGKFPTTMDRFLAITDSEVTSAIHEQHREGSDLAKRIAERKHFKLLYERNPDDIEVNPEARQRVYDNAVEQFGQRNVRQDSFAENVSILSYPVRMLNGDVVDSRARSEVLGRLPNAKVDYVFAAREKIDEARKWLKENRQEILTAEGETDG